MAHDFAKKRQSKASGKRPSSKQAINKNNNHADVNPWSWFFTGLFSGLFFAVIAYFALIKPGNLQPSSNNLDIDTPAISTESDETEYDFYDLLVESEVQVDVVPVALIQNEVTEEENPTQYKLQAGSFQLRKNADSRLAKVILLNMNADIVPRVVSGKTWYLVQVGPFTGRSNTENARDVLASNNIDTLVLEIR